VNVTRLPLTPERIVRLIAARGGNAASGTEAEAR
jgi:hypothetical protein